MKAQAKTQPTKSQPLLQAEVSAFLAMARKELIIMARYPVNFIASFGQTFLIVAIFTLGGSMFFRNSNAVASNGQVGPSSGNPSGVFPPCPLDATALLLRKNMLPPKVK